MLEGQSKKNFSSSERLCARSSSTEREASLLHDEEERKEKEEGEGEEVPALERERREGEKRVEKKKPLS